MRPAGLAVLLALMAVTSFGCSRLSTCYIHNAGTTELLVWVRKESREDRYIVKPGDWFDGVRGLQPNKWEFDYGLEGEQRIEVAIPNPGHSSADVFVQIDEKKWRRTDPPLWYQLETVGGPIAGILVFTGLVALAYFVVRRESQRAKEQIAATATQHPGQG